MHIVRPSILRESRSRFSWVMLGQKTRSLDQIIEKNLVYTLGGGWGGHNFNPNFTTLYPLSDKC